MKGFWGKYGGRDSYGTGQPMHNNEEQQQQKRGDATGDVWSVELHKFKSRPIWLATNVRREEGGGRRKSRKLASEKVCLKLSLCFDFCRSFCCSLQFAENMA
jgi:hypothetical protein